jgi:murein L,D-transpeptidase YcbB/YkuD
MLGPRRALTRCGVAIAAAVCIVAVATAQSPNRLAQDLESARQHYALMAADSTLTAIARPQAAIRPGARFDEAGRLRRFLVAVGDMAADAGLDNNVYAGALVDAVKTFQARHGIETDGVIGARTAAAMAVPLITRLAQIDRALEILRHIPYGEGRGVMVNIAMFQLWAWDAGTTSPPLTMRVIVGRARKTPTPSLTDRIEYLIVRPYWNVPASIVRGEILPKLARDPDYLRRENMELVAGAGDSAAVVAVSENALARLRAGTLRLRQRPGPSNALGRLKFVFPNEEDGYLHDTPTRLLFRPARRDFSHGCVRVEDAVALGEWILNEQPEWKREAIVDAMNGTRTRRVDLRESVPVVLFYATAMVWPMDGTVHFADDIYGLDAWSR